MSTADNYRIKAAQLSAEAKWAAGQSRIDLLHMAKAYVRLAEQADKNQHCDVCYETPLGPGESSSSSAHPE
jgi:hypothetical protein